MKYKLLLFIPFLISIYLNPCYAEKKDTLNSKHILSNLDSLRIAKVSLGKFKITPFIVPSYTPETELLISGGGLISYSIQKKNKKLSRSSISFEAGYSTNRSKTGSITSTIYGKNDKTRFYTNYWMRNMPDRYWGVGYDYGRNQVNSDSTTLYYRNWFRINHKTLFRVNDKIFIGFIIDYNSTIAKDLNPVMNNDEYILKYGTDIKNTGFGITLQYDTRDYVQNAYEGYLLEGNYTNYNSLITNDFRFSILNFDLRKYITLSRHRQTLALQCRSRVGLGDVPWTNLSQLGSPNDLRGYFWGRYRDKSYLYGIAEFRHMFKRFKPSITGSMDSRLGYVLWCGFGSISKKITGFKKWLPNYGLGLRFEVQPRLNFRIDYGFGNDSKAMYFTFAESF